MPRGRKRKPRALLKLAGTYREDRHGGDGDLPTVKAPRCPAWLGRQGRTEWRRLTGLLGGHAILTAADLTALGLYCQALHEYHEAREAVEQEGSLVTVHGQVVPNPHTKLRDAAWARVVKLATEFGLTPAARARLDIKGSEPLGAADAFEHLNSEKGEA